MSQIRVEDYTQRVQALKSIPFKPQQLCIWFDDLRSWANGDELAFLRGLVDATRIMVNHGLQPETQPKQLRASGNPDVILAVSKAINQHLQANPYIAQAVETSH